MSGLFFGVSGSLLADEYYLDKRFLLMYRQDYSYEYYPAPDEYTILIAIQARVKIIQSTALGPVYFRFQFDVSLTAVFSDKLVASMAPQTCRLEDGSPQTFVTMGSTHGAVGGSVLNRHLQEPMIRAAFFYIDEWRHYERK